MAIRLPTDPRQALLAQIGQGLGQGVGGAFQSQQLNKAADTMQQRGDTLEDVFNKLQGVDPEFATGFLETGLKKRAKLEEEEFAKSMAVQMGLDPDMISKIGGVNDLMVSIKGTEFKARQDATQQRDDLISGLRTAFEGNEEALRDLDALVLGIDPNKIDPQATTGRPQTSAPTNMSGTQLKEQFPNDTRVQGIGNEEVVPVRVNQDGTLFSVGTRPPTSGGKDTFDKDAQSTAKLNLSIDPLARITDPNTQQTLIAIQKRAQKIGGDSGFDAGNQATAEFLQTSKEIEAAANDNFTEAQIREELIRIWGTDVIFEDALEEVFRPEPRKKGFFGFGGDDS